MKKVMCKWNAVRIGTYGWSIDEVCDDCNRVYSDPYYVEIPDDFYLGESVCGNILYFRNGCNQGYGLTIMSSSRNCAPYLVGSTPVETVRLNVVGSVED